MSCKDDDNPVSATSYAGTWNLVTFTEKDSNYTVNAGEPTEMGPGIFITITGTLILTETRFTLTQSMTLSMSGLPTETEDVTSTGTYSITGSTLTIVLDGTGETETMAISRSDNRVTIEDNEIIMVFEKE